MIANAVVKHKLDYVKKILAKAEQYSHAIKVLRYDRETICPKDAVEEEGEVIAFLRNQSFNLIKETSFIDAVEFLYDYRNELDEFDRIMVEQQHRDCMQIKNLTSEQQYDFSLVFNRAFMNWNKAREASDYSLFAESLKEVVDVNRCRIELRGEDSLSEKAYDFLLDDYERGMTTIVLDEIFGLCKERLIPLLEKIQNSSKKIRIDFLSRPVKEEQQQKLAKWLLTQMRFDFARGTFATSLHPVTALLGKDDVRVTTHYNPTNFVSSMYSTIHEGGHALFEQNQPRENKERFIFGGKTQGMRESVACFYENRIGRSESFVHFIYPKVCELFPKVMDDVSEKEFYEALNFVQPSLIRTEADEFTYTFHIIIRYEIEKALFAGNIKVENISEIWNQKYQEYLGVCPSSDREGVLQDMHWASEFGYFPAYAVGNFYNAMYYNRMKQELAVDEAVRMGDFEPINRWMTANVFAKADRLSPGEWIKDITGREITSNDFLDYLDEKYSRIYL